MCVGCLPATELEASHIWVLVPESTVPYGKHGDRRICRPHMSVRATGRCAEVQYHYIGQIDCKNEHDSTYKKRLKMGSTRRAKGNARPPPVTRDTPAHIGQEKSSHPGQNNGKTKLRQHQKFWSQKGVQTDDSKLDSSRSRNMGHNASRT